MSLYARIVWSNTMAITAVAKLIVCKVLKLRRKEELMTEETTTEDMFPGDSTDTLAQIDEFAQGLAVEMDAVDKLYKEHSRRKEAVDAAKEQLNRLLTEAGMESCKLECGLNPQAKINRRIFKASGLDDQSLHDWLRSMALGDIIKETVHHGTLNSTMKEWEDAGNKLPENTFQVSVRPTITMGGKTAYLAKKGLV